MKEEFNENNKEENKIKDDILDENVEDDLGEEKEVKVSWYISVPIIIILMLTKLFPLGIVLIIIRLIKTKNSPGSRSLTYLIIIAIGIYYFFAGVPDLTTEKNNTNTQLADKSGVELYTFDEKDEVDSYFENNDIDSVYLKEESKWFSADYYALTSESSNVEYIGEMKDNKPDGIGKLIIDDKVDYIGEFEDGRFEGYGEDYEDELLAYDGYFKNGKYQGKGNEYFYPNMILSSVDPELLEANNTSLDEVMIYVGTYKKGEAKGDFKIYNNGYLLYDGELKHDKMNGKGTIYFENSTQIKYEGEFRTNEYNGKGTLYDESGNVIYEGKWDMGDYEN